ncbi:DNA-binding protein [Streptomyces albogriseolus]
MSTEENPAAAPRSLAEALRGRDDVSLAALLRGRPDLITPVPTDLTQLATRAGTRASVVRALERLDRFTLQTAQALAVAPDPATYDELLGLLAGDDGDPAVSVALPHALGVLREQALVWGPDDRLRLVRTARELLAPSPQHPSPTGLGPTVREATAGMSPGRIQEIVATAGLPSTHDPVSAVAALTGLFNDPERMSALLDQAPSESVEVLERLVWGPPYGQVTAEPAARLRWLLDRGLLLPTAPGTVVLPREVALRLRAGRAHRTTEPVPPPVEAATAHPPQVVDATAAGQAYTALATVEELLKDWHEGGPAVLRAGGLSVRDLKRTAVALDVTEPVAAFWVELAYAAGLLAADGEADERYAATPAYDEWLERPAGERWARLATAWLAATRTPGLVGERDAKDRTLSALGPGLDRSAAPEVRHRALTLLAALPEGAAPAAESVLARLRWERPPRVVRTGGAAPAGARRTQGQPAEGARGVAVRAGTGGHGAPGYPGDGGHGTGGDGDDLRSRLARWTLAEAEMLGVTGRGALSAHGRALIGAPAPRHPQETEPTGPGDKLPVHHRPAPPPPSLSPRRAGRRRRGRRPAAGAPAARAAGPRAAPGRPDGGRAGPAGAAARGHAGGPGGRGVEGWRDRLPVHAGLGAARPGRRAVGRRPARLPRRAVPHPGAAAAGLPHRRRGPPARSSAGGRRLRVRALRRRRGAQRDHGRQAGRGAGPAAARPDRAGRADRPGEAAGGAARDGFRAGRRVRRGRRADRPRRRPPHAPAHGPGAGPGRSARPGRHLARGGDPRRPRG